MQGSLREGAPDRQSRVEEYAQLINLYVALMRVLNFNLPQLLPSHSRCDTSLRREALVDTRFIVRLPVLNGYHITPFERTK